METQIVREKEPVRDSVEARPEKGLTYQAPELHELGTLDEVQGSGGEFRDSRNGNYYPRHD